MMFVKLASLNEKAFKYIHGVQGDVWTLARTHVRERCIVQKLCRFRGRRVTAAAVKK